jgi:hypothetical protein
MNLIKWRLTHKPLWVRSCAMVAVSPSSLVRCHSVLKLIKARQNKSYRDYTLVYKLMLMCLGAAAVHARVCKARAVTASERSAFGATLA